MEPRSREVLRTHWHDHVDGAPWYSQFSVLCHLFQFLPVQFLQTVAPLVCREWATFLFSHPDIWRVTQEGPWTSPTNRSSQGLYTRAAANYGTLAGGRVTAVAVTAGLIAVGNEAGIHVFLLGGDFHLLTIDSLPCAPSHLAFGGSPASILAAGFPSGLVTAFALPPCGLSGGAFSPSLATPCVWVPAGVVDTLRLPGHPLSAPFGEASAHGEPDDGTQQYNAAELLRSPHTVGQSNGVGRGGDDVMHTATDAASYPRPAADRSPHGGGHRDAFDSTGRRVGIVRRVLLTPAVVKAAYTACPPRAVACDLSAYGFTPAAVTCLTIAPTPCLVVGDAAGRVAVWSVRSLLDGTPPHVVQSLHPPAGDYVCAGNCLCFDAACTRAASVPWQRVATSYVAPMGGARGGIDARTLPTGRVPPSHCASRLAFLRPAVASLVGLCSASACDAPSTSLTDGSGMLQRWRPSGPLVAPRDGDDTSPPPPDAPYLAPHSITQWSACSDDSSCDAMRRDALGATGWRALAPSGAVDSTSAFAHAGRVSSVTLGTCGAGAIVAIVTGGSDYAVRVFAWPSLIHVTTLGGLMGAPVSLGCALLTGRVGGTPSAGIMSRVGDVVGCGAGSYVSSVLSAAAAAAVGHRCLLLQHHMTSEAAEMMAAGVDTDPPLAVTAASVSVLQQQMTHATGRGGGARKRAAPGDDSDTHPATPTLHVPLVIGSGVLRSPGDGHATEDGGPPDAAVWHACSMAAAAAWPPADTPPLPVPGYEVVIAAAGADRRMVWWVVDFAGLYSSSTQLHAAVTSPIAQTPLPMHRAAAAVSMMHDAGIQSVMAWPPCVRGDASPPHETNRKRCLGAAAAAAAALSAVSVISLPERDVQLSILRALMMRIPSHVPYMAQGEGGSGASAPASASAGGDAAMASRATLSPSAGAESSPKPAPPGDGDAPADGGDAVMQGSESPGGGSGDDTEGTSRTEGGGAAAGGAASGTAGAPAPAPAAAAQHPAPPAPPPPGTSTPTGGHEDLAALAVASSRVRYDEYCQLVRSSKPVYGTLLLRTPTGAIVAVKRVASTTPLPLLRLYVALALGVAVNSVTFLSHEDGSPLVPTSTALPHPIHIPPSIAPGGSPLSTYAGLPVTPESGAWGGPPSPLPPWASLAVEQSSLTSKDGPFTAAAVAVAPTGIVSALTASGVHVTAFSGGSALMVCGDGAAHRFDLVATAHRSLRYVTFDSRVHPGTRPRAKDPAPGAQHGPPLNDVSTLHGLGHAVAPIRVELDVRHDAGCAMCCLACT